MVWLFWFSTWQTYHSLFIAFAMWKQATQAKSLEITGGTTWLDSSHVVFLCDFQRSWLVWLFSITNIPHLIYWTCYRKATKPHKLIGNHNGKPCDSNLTNFKWVCVLWLFSLSEWQTYHIWFIAFAMGNQQNYANSLEHTQVKTTWLEYSHVVFPCDFQWVCLVWLSSLSKWPTYHVWLITFAMGKQPNQVHAGLSLRWVPRLPRINIVSNVFFTWQ